MGKFTALNLLGQLVTETLGVGIGGFSWVVEVDILERVVARLSKYCALSA
jgi:hypothetical protein